MAQMNFGGVIENVMTREELIVLTTPKINCFFLDSPNISPFFSCYYEIWGDSFDFNSPNQRGRLH